jgi:hypothetical protein
MNSPGPKFSLVFPFDSQRFRITTATERRRLVSYKRPNRSIPYPSASAALWSHAAARQ